MKTTNILAISGNDIFSGGGLCADLTTYAVNHIHGFVAVSCLTAMTENGFEVIPTDPQILKQQLDSLKAVNFSAVKIGLLPNIQTVQVVLEFLSKMPSCPIVLDPVLVCKEKHDLEVSQLGQELVSLFPYASLVTPNLVEAQLLTGLTINNLDQMKEVAIKLNQMGAKHVVIKGGNRLEQDQAIDLYYDGQQFSTYTNPVLNGNNAGAGCTFASSIASRLALGDSKEKAIAVSKDFVYQAIKNADQYGVVQYF
ncbi:bifunctional hydroxymethylpyrimidine kinase/phosphomethylpyrimidine kinase [Streptococcus halichoeri]|uniref:bifunctional hydroxymethylpyrimidine kinase/phosphomethylpyrimidine kinase n=1 Tax=Streptococcus halichoeri TaxID=254785 RepID=UPI00135B0574|nr:bifunctional hydroxymethylpyrimidine kinase/phosphomethylpyrimidine kinase [Streptococcus halichoeri]